MKTRRFRDYTKLGIDYVVKIKIPDEVRNYPYSSRTWKKYVIPTIKAMYK